MKKEEEVKLEPKVDAVEVKVEPSEVKEVAKEDLKTN